MAEASTSTSAMASTSETASTSNSHRAPEVMEYQFKIELGKMKPPLWRRVVVPSNMCFNEFHKVIMCLFGWRGGHLHKFSVPEVEGAWINLNPQRRVNIERKPISNFFKQPRTRADYVYDFGASWLHHIELEGIKPLREGITYPRCIAGRRVNLVEYPKEDEEDDITTKFRPSQVDFSRMQEFEDY